MIRNLLFLKIIIVKILFSMTLLFSQRWTFEDDYNHINTFNSVLDPIIAELTSINPSLSNGNYYFTNRQHDNIENLLFKHLLCTKSLFDIANTYKNINLDAEISEQDITSFLIGYKAALVIFKHNSKLILETAKNSFLISKLNEEYPRKEIKKYTYDRIVSNMTNPTYIRDLDIASELFNREVNRISLLPPDTSKQEDIYSRLILDIKQLNYSYSNYRQTIIDNFTILPLEASELLNIHNIEKIVNEMISDAGGQLKAIQKFLMTVSGDIKIPLIEGLRFSERKKKQIKTSLQPGDLILTYSRGYMSNIFLPGYFKHILVYTGYHTSDNSSLRNLILNEQQTLKIKPEHDIIESVSEGVVTSNFDYILDGYVNRLAIFRPNLSKNEINSAMIKLHSFLGFEYDFNFDLENGEKQACTELIYRAYNGLGTLDFKLNDILGLGLLTLSGDDYLKNLMNNNSVDLILLIDESQYWNSKPKIYLGDKGVEYLWKNIPEILN